MNCPHCGSCELVGGRYFDLVVRYSAKLPCVCGAVEDAVAAVRAYRRPVQMEEWGQLDDDGDWVSEEREEVEESDEEEGLFQVFCPACLGDADPEDWQVREIGRSEDRAVQTPFVGCTGCGPRPSSSDFAHCTS
jgi:hypothetical protein